MADLTELTFAQARAGLDARDFSVADLTDAYLARIEEYAWLNAYLHVDAGGAREAAAELDRELADGRHRGPLHGVPVGIKDAFPIQGIPLTLGSEAIDIVPAEDCEMVANLRAGGAVILGTQAMGEGGLGDPIREGKIATGFNPRNLGYLTGGSSTGSGAAAAAGLALLSIGADGGGSVRIPAAACGTLGFKPTNGRMPAAGGVPWAWSIDSAGILSRDMAGIEAGFQAATKGGETIPASEPRLVALPEDCLGSLAEDVAAGYREAVEALGATIGRAVEAISVDQVMPNWSARLKELEGTHALTMVSRADRYTASIRAQYPGWGKVSRDDYLGSFQYEARLDAEVQAAMDGYDALILPTNPTVGLRWGEWPGDPAFDWFRLCMPFNLTRQPAISVPWRLNTEGLPICFQVVGRREDDERLLGVARWCAERTGFDPATVSPQRPAAVPA